MKKKDPRIERLKRIFEKYGKPVDFIVSLVNGDMSETERMNIEALFAGAGAVSVFLPYYQLIDGRMMERAPYINDNAFLEWVAANEMEISNPVALGIVQVDVLANIDFRTGIGATVQSRVHYAGEFVVTIGLGEHTRAGAQRREYSVKMPVLLTQEIFPFDRRNIHIID